MILRALNSREPSETRCSPLRSERHLALKDLIQKGYSAHHLMFLSGVCVAPFTCPRTDSQKLKEETRSIGSCIVRARIRTFAPIKTDQFRRLGEKCSAMSETST
eukprot:3349403-Pyramimonas_sp.AAC.1